jgi:polyphenol oxidase
MPHRIDTRRMFLQRAAHVTAAAGAAGFSPMFGAEPTDCAGPKTPKPITWKPDKNPIRPRNPASTLSAAEVTKLRDAYTALRKLTTTTPNDPRGWLQQGDKHCWNCGGGLDGKAGEKEVTLSIVPLTQGSQDDRPVFSRAYFAKN